MLLGGTRLAIQFSQCNLEGVLLELLFKLLKNMSEFCPPRCRPFLVFSHDLQMITTEIRYFPTIFGEVFLILFDDLVYVWLDFVPIPS